MLNSITCSKSLSNQSISHTMGLFWPVGTGFRTLPFLGRWWLGWGSEHLALVCGKGLALSPPALEMEALNKGEETTINNFPLLSIRTECLIHLVNSVLFVWFTPLDFYLYLLKCADSEWLKSLLLWDSSRPEAAARESSSPFHGSTKVEEKHTNNHKSIWKQHS